MALDELFLIDANSYAHRAYHAIKGLTGPGGEPIGAAYGFASMLLRRLARHPPAYAAACFDAPGPTFRHERFEEYKAGRPQTPDELAGQFPLIKEICAALGVHVLELPGYEADDLIATLARQAERRGLSVAILTSDKDALQLVSDRIRVVSTHKEDFVYDRERVLERFGVPPEKIVEVMALAGDTVDNIPGVRGIGPKTASALINAYGTLEGVYEHLDELAGKAVGRRLAESREEAFMSRELARVDDAVPLGIGLEELAWRGVDRERALELFRRLGFASMVRLVESLEPVSRAEGTGGGAEEAPRPSVVSGGGEGLLGVLVGEGPEGPVAVAQPDGGVRLLPRGEGLALLRDASAAKAVYDLKALYPLGPRGVRFDVQLAGYLLDPDQDGRSLALLAREYLGVPLGAPGDGQFELAFGGETARLEEGARAIARLAGVLAAELEAAGLRSLHDDLELPLAGVLARMEATGMYVDGAMLEDMSRQLEEAMRRVEERIHAEAGEPFNVNSSRQLGEVLFSKMRLPEVKQGKTGPSTDSEVLEELAAAGHEIAALVLEYRQLAKLRSTYTEGLVRHIDAATGRIHPTFSQVATSTGRLSCRDPNLQNIPVRSELGGQLRRAFRAPAGRAILCADYSQIELRVLAHLSRDPVLLDAFARGEDVHARTAAELFGISPDGVDPDRRRAAKVVNFGVIYGMSPHGLSRALRIKKEEAAAFIQRYFERYRGVARYLERVVEEGVQTGEVRTIMGRRKLVRGLDSPDRTAREAARRAAVNAPVQGSAADIIKTAMVRVDRRLRESGIDAVMVLQVHDELVFETAAEAAGELAALVREEMAGAVQLAVPLVVEVGVGADWLEAH